jgi:hypothetical protein
MAETIFPVPQQTGSPASKSDSRGCRRAWVAVGTLLPLPDDRKENERSRNVVAADRTAAIISCSWTSAEGPANQLPAYR